MQRPRRRFGEGGTATTQLVVVFPAVFFMLMLVVQFGLWYHGSHLATAAAQEGARAARVEGATAGQGKQVAQAFLDELNSELIQGVAVRAERDGERVRVEVTGASIEVVPGFSIPIRAVSDAPVERFRGDQ
jgi:Flp pilus assembly protein TadG